MNSYMHGTGINIHVKEIGQHAEEPFDLLSDPDISTVRQPLQLMDAVVCLSPHTTCWHFDLPLVRSIRRSSFIDGARWGRRP